MHATNGTHDVLVIGGGPGGAVAAREAARRGFRTLLIERDRFPRFHIGESMLPRSLELMDELGLRDRLAALPTIRKMGAEFAFGHGRRPPSDFPFSMAMGDHDPEAFNVERAPFDAMLLDAARDAGVEVREGIVRSIETLRDDDVAVIVDDETIRARVLIDASGHGTIVGRHLGTRRFDPDLQKVAHFAHITGVDRREGEPGGYISIVMCSDAWFWQIPVDEQRTSVGLVMDRADAERVPVPPKSRLRWAIERCPEMARRFTHADLPAENGVVADFTYTCRPYAGPGYFLTGDAATFLDPIFSSGVTVAMISGVNAVDAIERMFRHDASPSRERKRYIQTFETSTEPLLRLVRHFYRHSFRELFMNGKGPLAMHRAVMSVLVGDVFPNLPRRARWRLRLFDLCVRLQRHMPLTPRLETFSLLEEGPGDPATSRASAPGPAPAMNRS